MDGVRSLPLPFPKNAHQAEILAMAERLSDTAASHAARYDRENGFPFETFQEVRKSGYLALTVPKEYGGRGERVLEVALAQEALARGDGSLALTVNMHLQLIARLGETRAWPEVLFAKVCRDIVDTRALINAAHSEPELGSPSRGGLPVTTVERVDGGWKISGRKSWVTGAPALRYTTVIATFREEGKDPRRLSFLVPMDAPGVSVVETWDNLGMRATASHDVVLDGVVVPDEYRLPGDEAAGKGDPRAWTLTTAAVYTGIAAAARDFAVEFARGRRPAGQQGASIAEFQTVQHRVAEIDLLLLQSRSILYGTAEAWDEQPELRDRIAWQVAAAKLTATNNAIRVTDLALRVVGSAGQARSLPLERYFRDVRAGLGQPPIDDIALTQIGKGALGI
jgi:alkylation response protein AidB-like acyl-CoA dehydrogenase